MDFFLRVEGGRFFLEMMLWFVKFRKELRCLITAVHFHNNCLNPPFFFISPPSKLQTHL